MHSLTGCKPKHPAPPQPHIHGQGSWRASVVVLWWSCGGPVVALLWPVVVLLRPVVVLLCLGAVTGPEEAATGPECAVTVGSG